MAILGSNNSILGTINTTNVMLPSNPSGDNIGGGIIIVPSYNITDGNIVNFQYLQSSLVNYGMVSTHVLSRAVEVLPHNRFLDYGVLTNDVTFNVTMRNATVEQLEIEAISYLSMIGLETTVVVGDIIDVNAATVYEFKMLGSTGASVVNTDVTIYFTNGTFIQIHVYAIRSSSFVYSVYPVLKSYSEGFIYKTALSTFSNGREVRQALLKNPKIAINYSVQLYSKELRQYFLDLLYIGSTTPMLQPLWGLSDTVSDSLDGKLINISTAGKGYKIGSEILLQNDQLSPIIDEVVEITETSILLKNKITLQAPYTVAPVALCMQNRGTTITQDTINYATASISLKGM